MLYIYYGEHIEKRMSAIERTILSYQKKGYELFDIIDSDHFDSAHLKERILSVSLFGGGTISILEYLFESADLKEKLFELSKEMADSENIFIVIERDFNKETIKKFKKITDDIEGFERVKVEKKKFNIFALTDALASRNKKEAWVILQKAFREKITPEEIHGILFWQIKTMLLVAKTEKATASSTGLNPYVFKKAEFSLKKFQTNELEYFSSALLESIYGGRKRGDDPYTSLESLILKNL